jgi:arylsulfatase A-like enzyme
MADQAIKWLDNWKGLRDAPFFMYYTPGAVHAPIQVPKEWRDKYKGQFDDGWHAYRAQKLLERQKKMGLVPEDAKMVDWPEVIPEWDSFSEEGKEVPGASDGGQCGLPGTCRLSHRPGDRPS